MRDQDTIAAIATASGRGGIGIIRLSGPAARDIGEQIAGVALQPRRAHACTLRVHAEPLDSAVVLFFPAPASFTGEDVIELHGHGSPVMLDILLRHCCELGARLARPGEFSERAFVHGKLDLTQAEAIADLINSSTEQAARNASRSLQGAFSREIEALVAAVTALRVYIEAAIDFPEEEIDFLADGRVSDELQAIENSFASVMQQAHRGRLIREGIKLVIAGKPNAGKSSLLNSLSGQDSAIVTATAGTTRDVLREHIQIDGMPLHIVDTAGLRDSGDIIEQEGIRRAWRELESADRILLVIDTSSPDQAMNSDDIICQLQQQGGISADIPVTLIYNKCDLSGDKPRLSEDQDSTIIHLSAKTGAGVNLLRNHLKDSAGLSGSGQGAFSARRRHLQALQTAHDSLRQGRHQLESSGAGELLAEDLRQCQNALGEITGAISSDDLLGEIFSSFCIGK